MLCAGLQSADAECLLKLRCHGCETLGLGPLSFNLDGQTPHHYTDWSDQVSIIMTWSDQIGKAGKLSLFHSYGAEIWGQGNNEILAN